MKLERVVEELKEEIWELDTNNRFLQHIAIIIIIITIIIIIIIITIIIMQVHSTKPAHTAASYQRVELLGPLPKVSIYILYLLPLL